MIEIDVTEGREKIKKYKLKSGFVSFNAWLIKVISLTIRDYESIASFMNGKRKIIIFNDINISIAVEKEMNGQKVPIPLVIEKADEISLESIAQQLEDARSKIMGEGDIVLQRNENRLESIYYYMPGFVRRMFWKYLLKHPRHTSTSSVTDDVAIPFLPSETQSPKPETQFYKSTNTGRLGTLV